MKFILIVMIFLPVIVSTDSVLAQNNGSISGKVTDNKTSEELIGANVIVLGTMTGASTDIDGNYVIKGLQPGTYKLKFSYISYQNITVENIIVKADQDTKIDVSLNPASTELQEVVVTAEALKNTEASVLKIQRTSNSIVDGMSAELISKNNSSNGTDVLKRMTGITISEGKYAFIRGIGDRYNNTLLNGANLPSTDPEKKSFSYDLFPANLIENVITAKTFTPDKPADFSGGLVQINTIEFPSRFIFDFNTSFKYNTNTTGKDFRTYTGSSTDFLGYDNGTRELPATITDLKVARGNYSDSAINAITNSFNNDWSTKLTNAPFNGGFKLTVGDNLELGDNSLGYIGSASYSNSAQTKNLERSLYDFSGSRYNYTGSAYTRSVELGGLLNFSYKFANMNKISFKNIYNRNADDETTIYKGDYRYAEQYREVTGLKYVSRSLFSSQLVGEHELGIFNGITADWNLNFSQSKRDEPDNRRYVYARSIDDPSEPLRFQLDQSLATKYFGNLNDKTYGASADFNIKLFENPELPKIKTGYYFDKKNRSFEARTFGFKNIAGGSYLEEDSVIQLPVNQIFREENVGNRFIQVTEITRPTDSYTADQHINATYLMFDATLINKVRLVAGARYENSVQELNTVSEIGDSLNINNSYNDILPAVNVTYLVNENINIRAAYSITIARPEFRELAPFSYFDFIANELVDGNIDLKRTLINNYDLRFELYPRAGELASLSFFYKIFHNPIEQVLKASTSNEPIRSFENGNRAENYGAEVEIRKNLNFITDWFENFSLVGNASLIHSKIKVDNAGFQKSERALQGQADYIFNLGLYYDNYDMGLNASFVYNKVGQRIDKVGTADLGNIIELPVDLLDLSISQKLFGHFKVKLLVKDLLNQDRVLIQQSPVGDKPVQIENLGRTVSLSIGYSL
jgi:TonB-dependent receptor